MGVAILYLQCGEGIRCVSGGRKCTMGRASYLLCLLLTSCDLFRRVVSCPSLLVWPAQSPSCSWLWGALLVSCIGRGTVFLEVSSSLLPAWTFFFVLVAVAFLFSFKLAAYEIGWRSAWSRTIISDGLDFATCTNSGFTSSSFTCRFVTPELVFGLIWKYSFPACTASVRLCGFIFNRRFCK